MTANTISVVLPVYNDEETAEAAIKAVLNQDYQDIELVISEDGCTDDTHGIVATYAQVDERIKCVSSSHNLGVSHARNAALDVCEGAYVAFVDADDLPAPNWLSTLKGTIGSADMAACGYDVVDLSGNRLRGTSDRQDALGEGMCSEDAPQFIEDLFSNRLMYQGYVWNKLFRRDLLMEGDPLKFKLGIAYNEDRLFVFEYLRRCEEVAVTMLPVYEYHAHPAVAQYNDAQATELVAFDFMIAALEGERGLDNTRALFYAEKDYFRAVVELYCKASDSCNPDAEWLRQEAVRLASYADAFSDYPLDFHVKIKRAISGAPNCN